MSRFGWRTRLRSPRSAQRKPTGFAFTVSNLEERTMLSLVSGVVADINQQVANSQTGGAITNSLTVLNGTMYFNANDGIHGTQLWKSDGTAAGTTMVTDLPQNGPPHGGPSTYGVVDFGGAIFFEAASSNAVGLPTIDRSDGTPGGTSSIFTPDSSAVDLSGLTISGSSLYFLTSESGDSGAAIDLWKSDGTSSGTTLVASIPASQYSSVTDVNGKLYFTVNIGSANSPAGSYQLWSSDGTAAGTTEVTPLNGPLEGAAALGNELVFAEPDRMGSAGASLWLTDGTSGGTVQLHDFQPSATYAYVLSLTSSGGNLYFAALSGSDLQLWRTDGTVAGTIPLTTAKDGSGGVDPDDLVDMGGKLYFLGNDAASGHRALWSSDGTAAGTKVIADLGGSEASYSLGWGFFSNSDQIVASDNTLFIARENPPSSSGNPSSTSGFELWESDGTASGTTDLGSLPQTPSNWTANGATFYFTATDAQGSELWYAKSSTTPTPPPPTPAPTPTPTPSSPSPAPTSTVAPTSTTKPAPTPTPIPAPTIIGEQAIFQRKVNKRGKPIGKAVLSGFTLEFSRPMSASVVNAADYQLEEVQAKAAGKHSAVRLKAVSTTVSYDTSSNTVTVNIAGKQSFSKGGVLTVNTALASAAGKSLAGTSAFTISPGGKTIAPA